MQLVDRDDRHQQGGLEQCHFQDQALERGIGHLAIGLDQQRQAALDVLGREAGRLLAQLLQFGVGQIKNLLRFLDRTDHQQVAEVFDQLLAELAHVVADRVDPLDPRQDRLGIAAEDRCRDVGQQARVHGADQGGHILIRHGAVAEGQHLVEGGQGVAHAAVPLAGDQRQGGVADDDLSPCRRSPAGGR